MALANTTRSVSLRPRGSWKGLWEVFACDFLNALWFACLLDHGYLCHPRRLSAPQPTPRIPRDHWPFRGGGPEKCKFLFPGPPPPPPNPHVSWAKWAAVRSWENHEMKPTILRPVPHNLILDRNFRKPQAKEEFLNIWGRD